MDARIVLPSRFESAPRFNAVAVGIDLAPAYGRWGGATSARADCRLTPRCTKAIFWAALAVPCLRYGGAGRRSPRQRIACLAQVASRSPLSGTSRARSSRERRAISQKSEWETVAEMSFLLRPPPGVEPRAVLCFAGGALVGAAPQVTYDRFLRMLAERGFVVIAVGYAAGLNYDTCADLLELRYKRALESSGYADLPVWGLGHSLGALAQVLISCRHPSANRRGQILLSYTRRGEEALPIVRTAIQSNPILGPLLRALDVEVASDLLDRSYQFTERFFARAGAEARNTSVLLRDLVPVARQMLPLLREVGAGQADFRPSAGSFASAVDEGYSERRTLLLRLGDNDIDETAGLVKLLADLPVTRQVNFDVRALRGAHLLPLLPDWSNAASSVDWLLSQDRRGMGLSSKDQWERASEGQRRIVDAIDEYLQSP